MLNFSVFTLQSTEVGEKYGCKMIHGVLKAKGIIIGETKTGKIMCEINPKFQRSNFGGRSLNAKV